VPNSKITSKHQTTVPREIRDQLRVGPGDVLHWEIVGGSVRLSAGERAFLKRRGSVRVGPGSISEDIAKARALRGSGVE
jgi:bifunctional DNA-binding transcriptional regulator/antitoxin component of YhaV-PrlF toxin-antitoxin module